MVLERPVRRAITAMRRPTRSGCGRSAAGRRLRGCCAVPGSSPVAGRARAPPRQPPRHPRRKRARGRAASRCARRSPSSLPSSVSCTPTGKRSSSTSRVDVLLDQLARRPFGHDLGLVHHDQPVAQLLGLVHVVRGQDERRALLLQAIEAVPDEVARLRVEAGRGLVEEDQVRLVDQRSSDGQAPLHAAATGCRRCPCAAR